MYIYIFTFLYTFLKRIDTLSVKWLRLSLKLLSGGARLSIPGSLDLTRNLQEAFREPFLDKTKKPWVWPTSQDEGLALGGLPGNPGGGGDHAQHIPRWWFRICSIFTAIFGEDDHFDEHIFQMG